jgi:hypothetical protein
MGFIVFVVVVFIVVSVIRGAAARVQAQARMVLPPDFFGTQSLPEGHVRHVGGGEAIVSAPGMVSAPAMIPAAAMGEESSSEQIGDETAYDHDQDLSAAEVVTLEALPVMSTAPRAIPVRTETLEHEVDWNAEHDRFHKRYVDAKAPVAAASHGLMDELRDPAGARRAVLMAEILGPPVSMRR